MIEKEKNNKLFNLLLGICQIIFLSVITFLISNSIQAKTDIEVLKNNYINIVKSLEEIKSDLKDIRAFALKTKLNN